MRVEDAFRRADADQSNGVVLAEFTNGDSAIADLIAGRPTRTHVRTAATGPRTPTVPLPTAEGESWNWRFIGLLVFNVALLGGFAWLLLRRPAHA